MLTKEQILNANDLETQTVDVPEWGGSVRIREMTGSERDAFEQATLKKNGKNYDLNLSNIRARLCSLCIVDEYGQRMFSDSDISALSAKSSRALDRLFSLCQKLNGLNKEDVDELSKNSLPARNDDSISG